MSDTAKRDAVLEEFAHDAGVHRVWSVAGMADEILRLRDENAALRAEIDRLRDQLHLADQSARSSRAEAERIRAEIERILTEARAEINHLCRRADRAERILAALREPSEAVVDAVHGIELREEWYARAQLHAAIIRAAVAAAEQEVGRE